MDVWQLTIWTQLNADSPDLGKFKLKIEFNKNLRVSAKIRVPSQMLLLFWFFKDFKIPAGALFVFA